MSNLVIVESPAKAKTIKKYLGKGYEVKASVGHIIDLPPSTIGVNLESGQFEPEYEPIKGKGKVIKDLKAAAKKADQVFLAPDPDREGEAIAYHLSELLKGTKKNPKPIFRVRFHEITKSAIEKAFEVPAEIDINLFNAQQARRILDRVVGYQISPILWKKVRRGLSAGRVQSVAVRLVAERETEIRAFKAEEYWNLEGRIKAEIPPEFVAKLLKVDGKKAKIENAEQAEEAKEAIKNATAALTKVQKKERKRKSGPPFITSKLQQDASRAFNFSPKRTMRIAQNLYEGIDVGEDGPMGLITYMRTDSTNVSDEAIKNVRGFISGTFGEQYLPEKPNYFKSKKRAQEAHEAIRPTQVTRTPEKLRGYLKPDEYKIYKLIWERFVASQMVQALYDQTQLDIEAAAYLLRATGSILRFDGFLRVYQEQIDEDDKAANEAAQEEGKLLPDLKEGDKIEIAEVLVTQHFTQPRPRFNDASLVKELEEKGIGRPSTYAAILSVILDKEYVEKKENRLYPTELGEIVNSLLCENFKDIMDATFTASMEEKLDFIEEGKVGWVETLAEFYKTFSKDLEEAKENMRDVKRMEEPTDVECPKCKKHKMVIKWGKLGSFLGCSGYPDCKTTLPFHRDGDKIVVEEAPKSDKLCPSCGAELLVKRGKFGQFLGCSKYPDCRHTEPISIGVKCPKPECTGEVTEKKSKRGRVFYGCTKYPNCDFVSWNKPVNQPCKECDSNYLTSKVTKSGVELICPQCKAAN